MAVVPGRRELPAPMLDIGRMSFWHNAAGVDHNMTFGGATNTRFETHRANLHGRHGARIIAQRDTIHEFSALPSTSTPGQFATRSVCHPTGTHENPGRRFLIVVVAVVPVRRRRRRRRRGPRRRHLRRDP